MQDANDKAVPRAGGIVSYFLIRTFFVASLLRRKNDVEPSATTG
jgi:hypothetical protein